MPVTRPSARSPLTPDEVAAIRAPFRKATLLPGRAYHDESIYAWETEHVFFRDWIAVARAEELPEPGSFVLRDFFGENVILVRGRDQVVRAFYNVCRHRGTAVEERDCGKAVRFQCPYHAWIYDLDGQAPPGPPHRGPRRLQPRDLRPDPHPDRDLAGLRLPVLRRRGDDARPARASWATGTSTTPASGAT